MMVGCRVPLGVSNIGLGRGGKAVLLYEIVDVADPVGDLATDADKGKIAPLYPPRL